MISASAVTDIRNAKSELDKASHFQENNSTAQMLYFVCSILFWLFFALIHQIAQISDEIHNLRGVVSK